MKEKRKFFAYMAVSAYYVISKKVESQILRRNWNFRHVSINNSHWQSSGVIFFVQILYSYFKYTRRLFLGSALFVSGCNFYQSFMRNKEGIKVELQKKAHKGIFVRNITFLTACPPFYFSFCCFLRLLSCPSDILTEWPQ